MKYSTENSPLKCIMTNSTCYKSTSKMNVRGILWHSTGANNKTIKRYVQPSQSDPNYSELLSLIGKNPNGNDWNSISHSAGVNAWIGALADGSVTTVQALPWDYKPWGCGSGPKGSCNNGWIQFEICEDSLADPVYFKQVYQEACELTAYLCKLYDIDPNGTVNYNGVNVPTILCHADSCQLKLGSNHGDVLHWFPTFGKSMDTVRQDVQKLLEEEDEEMTQEMFNTMMNNYIADLAQRAPGDWSQNARDWAEGNNVINGDGAGNMMYKKYMTREEAVQILYNMQQNGL